MLKYNDYYRMFGIKRAMQLVAPRLIPTQKLQLPQESILHDMPDEGEKGIDENEMLLHNVTGPIYAEPILALSDNRGNPRHSMVSSNKLIREYHRKYRKIRQLHDIKRALADKRSVIVVNYGFLPLLWRYPANIYRSFNKWYNLAATVWAHMAELAQLSDRQQFLECRLPSILPSKAILNKGTGTLSTKILSLFADHESLFILEIWKWLSEEHRSQSILNKVPLDKLKNINLIWLEKDRWLVINLGLLNSWRTPSAAEVKAGAVDQIGSLPAISVQNRFLRMLMFLHEARNMGESDTAVLTEDEKIASAGYKESESNGNQETHPHAETAASIKIPKSGTDDEVVEFTLDSDLSKLPLDAIEETPENIAKLDKLIERDLSALDALHEERLKAEETAILEDAEGPLALPELEEKITPPAVLLDIGLDAGVMNKANQLADQGLLSAAEYRRMQKIATAYASLPNPYGEGLLKDEAKIDLSMLTITPKVVGADIKGIADKSMLKSSIHEFDSKYIKHILHKDILNAVLNSQKAGIGVTNYQVREVHDAMSHYEAHAVQLTPVRGKQSTFHFRIPTINEDGTFTANGSKYRLAKQRVDMPLRKTAPNEVALTSYYAKVFISRADKKAFNYSEWLTNQVRYLGMLGGSSSVSEMMLGNVFDANNHTPRVYSILSREFRTFHMADMQLFFDYEERAVLLGDNKDLLKRLERKGAVLAGTWGKDKLPVLIGNDNVFYKVHLGAGHKGAADEGIELEVVGTIEDILHLDAAKMPHEIADIRILGKFLPVGIFLAYQLGITGLLKTLEANPIRRVIQGEQLKLSSDEYAVTFEDEKLVFQHAADRNSLILGGLASLNKVLSNYQMRFFDKRPIYFTVLDHIGLGVRYLKEMDLMVDMFVDPITKEILEKSNDPVTFIGLILKACEMLVTDWASDETDLNYQRFRGYERVAGAVYGELVKAIRIQRSRGTSTASIDINPYAVWQAIVQDSAVRLVEESNPVHELRSHEEVTFSGTGGRSARSMVGRSRVYHTNDLGVISESTKDSADVAITTYLSANPLIKDVRGISERHVPKETGASSYLSTSALLAPFADRDDGKRTNFIAVQNSSTTFCKGQRPNPIRTGYEKVIGHRTSDLFSAAAKQDGVVKKLKSSVIEVQYRDGSIQAIELGRRFGNTPDYKFPHFVVTTLKEGAHFKAGTILAHNSNYFEVDPLEPSQVLWKQGALLRVALMEVPETLEDSSIISQRAADLLETKMAKTRDVVVDNKQTIHHLVRVGDVVEVDSILCTIEDPITAKTGMFDEKSLHTLKLIGASSPKAKMAGVVEKIECFYHCDIDELSPSLQEIAHSSDMDRKSKARDLHLPYTSGRVDDSLRIDGNPLLPNMVDIRLTITADVPAGVGDKGVFANQMKTIFSRVMTGVNETLDGEPIDAIFGYRSFNDRIVLSPELMGTTNTILKAISKKAAAIYFGKA